MMFKRGVLDEEITIIFWGDYAYSSGSGIYQWTQNTQPALQICSNKYSEINQANQARCDY
jgi:hypothetical protein